MVWNDLLIRSCLRFFAFIVSGTKLKWMLSGRHDVLSTFKSFAQLGGFVHTKSQNLKTHLFHWFGLFSTQTEFCVTTVMCTCAVLGERVSVDDKNDMKAIVWTAKSWYIFGAKRRFQICLESKVIPCIIESSCLWESRSFIFTWGRLSVSSKDHWLTPCFVCSLLVEDAPRKRVDSCGSPRLQRPR